MLRRQWVTAALATAGLLAAGASVRAGDTLRLGLSRPDDAPTITLGGPDSLDADTYEVGRGGGGGHGGGGHGGGHGGGFHAGGGGFHSGGFHGANHAAFRGGFNNRGFNNRGFNNRAFYGRGWNGFGRGWYGYGRGWNGFGRGWYGGYGRGWYGNGYWPYYAGWNGYWPYYGNSWYNSYWPSYDYPSSVYYGAPYVYPSSTVVPDASLSVGPVQAQELPDAILETAPPPQAVPAPGTFPYDGGPRNPPPMPKADPAPSSAPATLPLDGHAVSLPRKPAYTYPAFGESLKKAAPVKDRGNTYLIRAELDRPASR